MAKMPVGPIDEQGKPIFPAATEDDDVVGHQIISTEESDKDDELAEAKPGPK
jgi:hypothetical protein